MFLDVDAESFGLIGHAEGHAELAQSERFAAAEPDLVEAIVEGVGQFAAGEWAPLNRKGDLEGAKLEN